MGHARCALRLLIIVLISSPLINTSHFFGYHEEEDPCWYSSVDTARLKQCLDTVKRLAADTSLYWFGDRWKSICSSQSSSVSNPITCYNPAKLQRYGSVGARLLRVITFDPAYLRNLAIFPELVFQSEQSEYEACDHVFRLETQQEIRAQPNMAAVSPWHLRKRPSFDWLWEPGELFTVLMVDVGFGELCYLAYNYPTGTVTAKGYTGPLNFRDSANPVAVLVYRQNGRMSSVDWRSALDDDSTFNVQQFMIINNLTQSLVGLNWVNVGVDGYAIQKYRGTGFVDACALLLRNRFHSATDNANLKFLPSSSLSSVDGWMSVVFSSVPLTFQLCCKQYTVQAARVQLDPLGDKELRPVHIRTAPSISVSRVWPAMNSEQSVNRRYSRHHPVGPDQGEYTLLALEEDSSLVLWLVINIPADRLSNLADGQTLLPYQAPTPADHNLHRYVFLLFRQQGPINRFDLKHYNTKPCKAKFIARCSFDVQELMARNGLTLVAVSWLMARRDEYVQSVMEEPDECGHSCQPIHTANHSPNHPNMYAIFVALCFLCRAVIPSLLCN